jgi:hypothetical protein
MRSVAIVAALLVVCTVGAMAIHRAPEEGAVTPAAQTQAAAPGGLYKPIVMNPLDNPQVQAGLEKFSSILAKEPEAAKEVEAGGDDEESEADGDEDLLGPDKCDKLNAQDKKCGDASKDEAAGDKKSSSDDDDEEDSKKGGKVGSQIKSLEKMIKKAMDLSKSIPDKLKELESLKKKQESQESGNAKKEAESTLSQHKALLVELGDHITTLETKLGQLKEKKGDLETSDASLKKELEAEKSTE